MEAIAEPGLLMHLISQGGLEPTPIHDAIREHDVDRVRALLKTRNGKKKINQKDLFQYTPLIVCAEQEEEATVLEIFNLLIESGADIDTKCKIHDQTALHVAAFHGNVNMVQTLIEAGANMNQSTDDNRTAIFQASFNGKPEVVKYLLSRNADITIRDTDRQSALDVAQDAECQRLLRAAKK